MNVKDYEGDAVGSYIKVVDSMTQWVEGLKKKETNFPLDKFYMLNTDPGKFLKQ